MKRLLLNNLKNIYGWRTKRKLLILAVDDYGNVRLASRSARKALDNAGLKTYTRFDAYDSLETSQDLEMLFEVLASVKDSIGRPAIFTAFSVPCNINFEEVAAEGFDRYIPELLPTTYEKLGSQDSHSYGEAWSLWNQGVSEGLLAPQFHGREHLNLRVFEEKLRARDPELMHAMKHRSYTSIRSSRHPVLKTTAAFDFEQFEETARFESIVREGMDAFERVFGHRAVHFNPPGAQTHSVIHKALNESGIKYIDVALIKHEHQGNGEYRRHLNFTGKKNEFNQIYLVRNVVFEPTENSNLDSVQYALKQIETAFRWRRPAILSSHRVNFCGHIDPRNRADGLVALRGLLKTVVQKWPDVEFLASHELGRLIQTSTA